MLLINWLTKVTNDSIVQGARPINVIRVGSNEDCRNGVSHLYEMLVEFDSGHRGHMDVSDQASRFDEMRGCEKVGCRRESLDGVTQRPHEPSHGLAKEPIILNNRNQYRFGHTASGSSLASAIRAAATKPSRSHRRTLRQECRHRNASARKHWLMPGRESTRSR
jgi:hypothetical protein